jgi:hypothetical protein
MHGDVAQAAAYNIALVLSLPFLTIWGTIAWSRALCGHRVPVWRPSALLVWMVFVLLMLFWILRNIEAAPFTALAPYEL